MNKKHAFYASLLWVITLLSWPFPMMAQNETLEDLVFRGVHFHDKGYYEEALECYKQALCLDDKSPLVHYEIALTLMHMGRCKEAIKHAKNSAKDKEGYGAISHIIIGSCYDDLGKRKKAVKEFFKGLKIDPTQNMLHYNLALTLYRAGAYQEAENHLIESIRLNPGHPSSHLLLGNIKEEQHQRVRCLLPYYFFLLLEPNSSRSPEIYEKILSTWSSASKKDSNNVVITIPTTRQAETSWASAEILLSMASITNQLEHPNQPFMNSFIYKNINLFAYLGEIQNEQTGLWWDLYVEFFKRLETEGHCTTFSYYISQCSQKPEVRQWLNCHDLEMEAFQKWLDEY